MPVIRFCPTCWAENAFDATICYRCGASLIDDETLSYDEKLMQALHHPIPDVREIAATILGQHRHQEALPALISRLSEETDIGVLCAICGALGKLGDCRVVTPLIQRLAQPLAIVVARAIIRALGALAQSGCREAQQALEQASPLSDSLSEEIAAALKRLQ